MISLPKPLPFKPIEPIKPKPRRLPERKSMTIALGLMALDGIVLAADSELSAGDFKLSGQKVFAVGYRPMGGTVDKRMVAHSCGVTGTGTSSYIEAVKERLFINYSQVYDGERNFEEAFGQVVSEFYKEHVVPFLDYQTVECPDFLLIIGIERNYHGQLWATDRTTIRKINGYIALGIGSSLATQLLYRFWWETDCVTTALLAAYVILEVKRCIPGCGQSTQVTCMTGGKVVPLNPNYIDDLERIFRRYWGTERLALFHLLGARGRQEVKWKDVSKKYRSLRREIETYAASIRKYVDE